MTQQIALVTGANRGLGLEIVRSLLQNGGCDSFKVILTARDLGKAQAALTELTGSGIDAQALVAKPLDVESEASINALAKEVTEEFGRLDVLINNAGESSVFPETAFPLTLTGASLDLLVGKGEYTAWEAWTKSYALNVVGPNFLTAALAPLLIKSTSPRVIFVSSTTASFEMDKGLKQQWNTPPPAGWPKQDNFSIPGYRSSKAASNMMARNWVRVFANDGVKVTIVDPGRMATGFGGGSAEKKREMGVDDATHSAELVKKVIQGEWDDHLGEMIGRSGVVPW